MITCPECGLAAGDDAKFCDRCGQGLLRAEPAKSNLTPLKPAAVLNGQYEIVALLSQSSEENRYRVSRKSNDSMESLQLRERIGPAPEKREDPVQAEPAAADNAAPADEDPSGPRAKTRELKLPAPEPAPASATGAVEEAQAARCDQPDHQDDSADAAPLLLTETVGAESSNGPLAAGGDLLSAEGCAAAGSEPQEACVPEPQADDLGDLFGRVLALSKTLDHPAFARALSGFAENGRVYLVCADETFTPLSRRRMPMREPQALSIAIQVCQAVSFLHRRGLRVNDICPDSVAFSPEGRVKLLGLNCVSNDLELQSDPIFNDGYTAPETYKGKKVDKRADVFSIGALLYTCLTGERLAVETWREEAGAVTFYAPHVVTPALEQAVRRAVVFNPAERWPGVPQLQAELVRLSGQVRLQTAALTDVGMVRELNEDSVMAVEYRRYSLIESAQSYLYVVADGMGGAAAGEVASAIAVGAIRDYVEGRIRNAVPVDAAQLLKDALEDANRRILEYQAANPDSRGMGSTAVAALIVPPDAAIAWVGDSRAYLCEDQRLRQLTKDHSLVQRLIEIGQLTPEQARSHEHKNVITRSLGARQSGPAGAEALALRLKRGDRIVMCSDGLTAHVDDDSIAEIVRRHDDPSQAARELVVAANARGGTDNVSVVVIFAE